MRTFTEHAGALWIILDVSDHHLTYRFTYRDVDGAAGYEVEVVATVRISDAAAAVRRRAQGIRTYVQPTLGIRVSRAGAGSSHQTVADTVTKLNLRRDALAARLRDELIGESFMVDDWLDVRVADISVRFDADTTTHLDQLVAADRTAEVDTRTIINRTETDRAEIKRRRVWEDYLGEQVSDPLKLAVAAAVADPNTENIKELRDKVNEDSQLSRAQLAALLNKAMDNKIIVDVGDITNFKAVVEGLQKGLAGDGAQIARRPESDKMIASAEVVSDTDELPADDSDRDWRN
jgi:hypothetical protein